jgi:osmoprotectant transport system ATP-binding protein
MADAARPMIRLDRVTKSFGPDTVAVRELSLDIGEGEFVCLVGPSGCGKTTTLRMINRLVEPTSGTIEIAGRAIGSAPPHELRRGIGYVIQQVGLFAHRTVAENIATVPSLLGWDKARITGRVNELIDLVGLDAALAERYPSELSGGQQQRVGVARALAADPPVLLMDEPFGAVDPIVRERLQDELLRLQERVRKTIVFVTHDIDEAIKLGDRVVVLNVGGVLEQVAQPSELLAHPANDFVARFVGGQRGVRLLALKRVADIELEPCDATTATFISPDATLLDALQAIIRAGVTSAQVEGSRRCLTLDRIAKELGDDRDRAQPSSDEG